MPYWRLFYHLIWATRQREPLITPERQPAIYRIVSDIARRHGVTVHAIGGMPDHLHLAVTIPPTILVSEVIGRIKGGSARAVNLQFDGIFFGWQSEYGVVSMAERDLPLVVRYIQNQARHHTDGRLSPLLERAGDTPVTTPPPIEP